MVVTNCRGLPVMSALPIGEPAKTNQLRMEQTAGKSHDRSMADAAIDPAVTAAATVLNFAQGTFGQLQIADRVDTLIENLEAVKTGNLNGPEAVLASQAHALNTIFTELARRSALNMGEYIEASGNTCGSHSRARHNVVRRSRP
jgi:hypothetical protein